MVRSALFFAGLALVVASGCGRRTPPKPKDAPDVVAAQEVVDTEPAGEDVDEGPRLRCEEACAKIGLILGQEAATLGPDAREMREAIERTSGQPCIQACEARGDPVSVACLIAATTLLEMGACQGAPQ